MSIQEVWGKFKDFGHATDLLLVSIIIVTALTSFILGRLSVDATRVRSASDSVQTASVIEQKAEIKNEVTTAGSNVVANEPVINTPGKYVASKSGTKYHLPWCGSAKQIKEENKIWFNSKEEAEKAGYKPASNCKGI